MILWDNQSFILTEDMEQFLLNEKKKGLCEDQSPPKNDNVHCPAIYDGLLCWNHTRAGETAQQHCPVNHNFNTSGNYNITKLDEVTGNINTTNNFHQALAYKSCLLTGEWLTKGQLNQSYTDYMECVPKTSYSIYIYFIGYSLSIIALVISLGVLFYFKQLNCHRILLHKNLFFCNLLNSCGWLLYFSILAMHSAHPVIHTICQALHLIANYFGTAIYFWMLSEGLYLLLILVFAFNNSQTIIRFCIILGWGVPFIVIVIFGGLRFSIEAANHCHWEIPGNLMYLMLVPIFVTIVLNMIFMVFILGILFNKLRNQNNIEQHQGQKAARAILILTPVMGLHSLLSLVEPEDKLWLKVHYYISALTNSLQGFLITMPFCFFNNEIHEAIRQKRRRLQIKSKAGLSNTRHQKMPRITKPKSTLSIRKKSCDIQYP